MIKAVSLAILLLAATLVPLAAQESGTFVIGIEDLPLMDGLVEDLAAGLVFDKPEGRIVEANAAGVVNISEVREFYAATLGQLGWQPAGNGDYQREDESLRITISGTDGAVTVQFSLSPN